MTTTLDDSQRTAAELPARRLAVRAGPGAGKTRVLIARIANLLRQGRLGTEILCLTYTTAAAEELQHRVRETLLEGVTGRRRAELAARARGLTCCTLHALALRLIREAEGMEVTVLDAVESDTVLAFAAMELGRFPQDRASAAALEGLPNRTRRRLERDGLVQRRAATLKAEECALSFDDLEHDLRALLDTTPSLRGRWGWVLVDEAQDLSRQQLEIVQALACESRVTVVYDPNQAIFGFRGADPEGLQAWVSGPQWDHVRLDRNYRCDRLILDACNALADAGEVPNPMGPGGSEGQGLGELRLRSTQTWGMGLVEDMREAAEAGSCAVLARSWRELEVLAGDVLDPMGVQYTIGRRIADAWHTPTMRWLMAAARWSRSPHDRLAMWGAIGWCAPLSLIIEARGSDDPIAHVAISDNRQAGTVAAVVRALSSSSAIATLVDMVGGPAMPGFEEGPERAMLERWAAERPDAGVQDLIEWWSLQQAQSAQQQADAAPITLTTIHGAKGLEWDRVWVLGLDDGHLPGRNVEEDRRLVYVAMSRARHRLTLVHSGHRPSRFLADCLPC